MTPIAAIIIFAVVMIGNALAIMGFHRACQYDTYTDTEPENTDYIIEDTKMIFWKVKLYSEIILGPFWSKPVYSCPTCMASLHGIVPFFVTAVAVTDVSFMTFFYWIFYTLALSGLTTLINER